MPQRLQRDRICVATQVVEEDMEAVELLLRPKVPPTLMPAMIVNAAEFLLL